MKPPCIEIKDSDGNIHAYSIYFPRSSQRPFKIGKWEIIYDKTGLLTEELNNYRIGKVKYVGKTFDDLINGHVYKVVGHGTGFLQIVNEKGFKMDYYADKPGPNYNEVGYGKWEIVEDLYGILTNVYHLENIKNNEEIIKEDNYKYRY